MIALRFRGPFATLPADDRRALLDRSTSADRVVAAVVADIIADVRVRGDLALKELSARFDPVVPGSLEISRTVRRRALDSLDPALRGAMERSASNIAAVHRASMPEPVVVTPEPGVSIVRRPDPLARVGVYAPGGRAAYPSSVLMGAVPARVAGVDEVVLCSPPSGSGAPADIVLAAAELAGVDRVFAVGGAGAIAAMAFGTATVPRVDRVVGPGNAYVAEAKLQLVGSVAIDSPAGPSELLVIADASVSPDIVAGEMLAQAEHDPRACVVAVCIGEGVAAALERSLATLIVGQPRADISGCSLRGQGGVLSVGSASDAVAVCNAYAPEHLLLACGDADAIAARIRGAGTIFIGETSSVSFGDYITGANHVLPTGGLARAYSGLSVLDFIRWTTCQHVERAAARSLSGDTALFANAEGLPGHAMAAAGWAVA
ncbi:MAG TPA: histidinol dehydrogenase [Gemmatimonadaceae bacterium]|nr:histidinol dehydrogenase [Gemmatimonadaceae bacterium]